MVLEHAIDIRVQYNETDGQRRVHHGQYINYFERGRVELLRSLGFSYRDFEADGLMLVVTEMSLRYLGAAVFDDLLTLVTRVEHTGRVRIEHSYHLTRPASSDRIDAPNERIVEGKSMIACVDSQGKPHRLPEYFR